MFRLKRERGAAAVEFALLLPVLVMILLATIEFGYAFFLQATVAGAARDSVRDYVIKYDRLAPDPQASAIAKAAAIDLARSQVPDPANFLGGTFSGDCTPGAQSTLTITYRYRSLTGLLDNIVGSNVIVTGKASMQCGG